MSAIIEVEKNAEIKFEGSRIPKPGYSGDTLIRYLQVTPMEKHNNYVAVAIGYSSQDSRSSNKDIQIAAMNATINEVEKFLLGIAGVTKVHFVSLYDEKISRKMLHKIVVNSLSPKEKK